MLNQNAKYKKYIYIWPQQTSTLRRPGKHTQMSLVIECLLCTDMHGGRNFPLGSFSHLNSFVYGEMFKKLFWHIHILVIGGKCSKTRQKKYTVSYRPALPLTTEVNTTEHQISMGVEAKADFIFNLLLLSNLFFLLRHKGCF